MFERIVSFVRELYPGEAVIPLHQPRFGENERKYVLDTIDSTFVSSVGAYVPKFETALAERLGVHPEQVVAVVNGTCALQVALRMAGVGRGDLVVTQSLTFVATCNAIRHQGAEPAFVDVERQTLGLSPGSLEHFFSERCEMRSGQLFHRKTGNAVLACVPMHTFGHPVRISEIASLCSHYGVALVEDAAESLGSAHRGRETGTFGDYGVLSFNGNKIVTTGGGGAVICKTREMGLKVKHLTTTAKLPHPWAFEHDEVGYNFRMPNLNAALGVAQMESLGSFLEQKRDVARRYAGFFEGLGGVRFIGEPGDSRSNFWLNAIEMTSKDERDKLLQFAHQRGVHCRPAWEPMHRLKLYRDCDRTELPNTEFLADRLVNLPSSARGLER